MNYKIREIEKKDYLNVARLYKNLRTNGAKYMSPFYYEARKEARLLCDHEVIKRAIIPKVAVEGSRLYVLEIENKVVWFIYGILTYPCYEVYAEVELNYIWGELLHIYIDDDFRGRWFASLLRDKLFSYFKLNNVSVVEIGVNSTNPAIEMYKKWWFKSDFCSVTKQI